MYECFDRTYDIECEEPYHNFVANGLVVHNSGKTLNAVRLMHKNQGLINTFSNIQTKGIKNSHLIKADHIIKKEIIDHKRKRNGEIEPVLLFYLD